MLDHVLILGFCSVVGWIIGTGAAYFKMVWFPKKVIEHRRRMYSKEISNLPSGPTTTEQAIKDVANRVGIMFTEKDGMLYYEDDGAIFSEDGSEVVERMMKNGSFKWTEWLYDSQEDEPECK